MPTRSRMEISFYAHTLVLIASLTQNIRNVASIKCPQSFMYINFFRCIYHTTVLTSLPQSQSSFQYFHWVNYCLTHRASACTSHESLENWHRTRFSTTNNSFYLLICCKFDCWFWCNFYDVNSCKIFLSQLSIGFFNVISLPFPRQKLFHPPSLSIYLKQSDILCLVFWTWRKTFRRSRGAVEVLLTAPKWLKRQLLVSNKIEKKKINEFFLFSWH